MLSLLAVLLLAVAMIGFLVRNGVYVALGAAGFALGIAGGWWAISKRAPRRWYGVIGHGPRCSPPGRCVVGGRGRGLGVLRPRAHLPRPPRHSRSGGASGIGCQPPYHRRRSGAPRETPLAPGPALQSVVGWRQGREVRIGGAGHFARGPDRDARPRPRPRRARPRRHRPGRRLPGDGGWRRLTGIGGLHRRGTRASLRLRGRWDAKPLRPRPGSGPPRPPPAACTPSAMRSNVGSTTRQ